MSFNTAIATESQLIPLERWDDEAISMFGKLRVPVALFNGSSANPHEHTFTHGSSTFLISIRSKEDVTVLSTSNEKDDVATKAIGFVNSFFDIAPVEVPECMALKGTIEYVKGEWMKKGIKVSLKNEQFEDILRVGPVFSIQNQTPFLADIVTRESIANKLIWKVEKRLHALEAQNDWNSDDPAFKLSHNERRFQFCAEILPQIMENVVIGSDGEARGVTEAFVQAIATSQLSSALAIQYQTMIKRRWATMLAGRCWPLIQQ